MNYLKTMRDQLGDLNLETVSIMLILRHVIEPLTLAKTIG